MAGAARGGTIAVLVAGLTLTGGVAGWESSATAQQRVLPTRPPQVWSAAAEPPAVGSVTTSDPGTPLATVADPSPPTPPSTTPAAGPMATPQSVAEPATTAPPGDSAALPPLLGDTPVTAATPPGALPREPAPPVAWAPDVLAATATFAPVRLLVPAIGADATVVGIGVSDALELQVPDDPGTLGFWEGGGRPVDATGTVTVTGHVSWGGTPGALRDLTRLRPGDSAWLIGPDGSGVEYVTERVETYLKSALPAEEIFADDVSARLVLITCGGAFDRRTGHHDSNVVAYLSPRPPGGAP